jgi:nucleoside-diphosphate-sugar epimerase
MKNPKILVSGATGWVGRELLHIFSESDIDLSGLILISSTDKTIKINGTHLSVSNCYSQDIISPVQSYFDFAFLTKNHFKKYGADSFKEINLKIISNSTNLIKRICPKTVILASSGAIYGVKNSNFDDALYADLKKNQEEQIAKACEISGSNLIVSRIFNLSGRGITKESSYAIADLTLKAMQNLDLTNNSGFKVTRRYCDLTQLLKLLVEMANLSLNLTFDTGGVKIDLKSLAYKITEVIDTKSKVCFPSQYENLEADNYFSVSDNYEKLLVEFLGIDSMSIDNQILNTRAALLSNM